MNVGSYTIALPGQYEVKRADTRCSRIAQPRLGAFGTIQECSEAAFSATMQCEYFTFLPSTQNPFCGCCLLDDPQDEGEYLYSPGWTVYRQLPRTYQNGYLDLVVTSSGSYSPSDPLQNGLEGSFADFNPIEPFVNYQFSLRTTSMISCDVR